MAKVTGNILTSGLRGKIGQLLVFRRVNGKTIVSHAPRKPDKSKETAAQRKSRSTFKEASRWAKIVLLDPDQKTYYQQRAKTLKLPNAYTAAIKDYMRNPEWKMRANQRGQVTHRVQCPLDKILSPESDLSLLLNDRSENWKIGLKNWKIKCSELRNRRQCIDHLHETKGMYSTTRIYPRPFTALVLLPGAAYRQHTLHLSPQRPQKGDTEGAALQGTMGQSSVHCFL
jgi:hypothetical protein